MTPFFVGIGSFILFLLFQAQGIYGGDSGDLVVAAFAAGVPHPPGYPLYTFLGFLLTRLPIFTVAWRVGLLSSVPHALTVVLVYLVVFRLTKQWIISLFSAAILVGNYLFFLYSVTPEVFALFDFFLVLLVYLLIEWKQTKKTKYLGWASFIFGLSLAHHHFMLFFVPAMVYWIWIHRKLLSYSFYSFISLFVSFLTGLLPYLYIPIAARGNAIINWDRAINLHGFIRLVTRADYGTFVSGGFYGAHLIERLLQVQAYGQLLLFDMTWIGIVLGIIGLFWLWRKQRKLFFFFLLALFFLGPGFFFYASFPLFNRFNLGTYERFLLPSYVFFSVLIGFGIFQVTTWFDGYIEKRLLIWEIFGKMAFVMVLFLYPLSIMGMTIWRFGGLPADRTADNLGYDIVNSVPQGSIVLMSRDTPLFIAQYVRYALEFRPDIVLLHANKLSSSDYPPIIAKNFPHVTIPQATGASFPSAFIKANASRFPVFTNTIFPLEKGWFWVPYGLLYQLTPEVSLPSMDAFYRQNRAIWDGFGDPTKGIVTRYNHLMLSDVRDVYASARVEFGKTLLKAGKLKEAKEELERAISYGGDTQISDAYTLIGLSELFANHCKEALDAFTKARQTSFVADKALRLYEGVTYRDCSGDTKHAQTLFDEYEKLRKKEEIPLR